jgi:hypothetical protein
LRSKFGRSAKFEKWQGFNSGRQTIDEGSSKMNTATLPKNYLALCAGKDCRNESPEGAVICGSCIEQLDGILDELERNYPFLTLLVNNTFATRNTGGVIDGSINLTALECVDNIDRIIASMFDHVARMTSNVDYVRDIDGEVIPSLGASTSFEVPLPMGGVDFPTLRRAVWLRESNGSFFNVDFVANHAEAGKWLKKLKREVALASDLVTSKAGRVLLGSCRHCNDERDLWLEKGSQIAVCRSCWKTNNLADNFDAALSPAKKAKLMTAPTISKAFAALDILLTTKTIASWEHAELRRVEKAALKGEAIVNRLEVKQIITVKNFDGTSNRERKLYDFDEVMAYWRRVHEAKMSKQRAARALMSDDFIVEVTA